MKTATTTAAQLEEAGRRLDASYHASDGIRAHQFIRRWAGQTMRRPAIAKGTTKESVSTYSKRRLDTVAEVCMPGGIFIGGRAKRIYVLDAKHGVPFLSSSDMLMASFEEVKLISRKQPGLETLILRKGWTLVSRSGTIGNMAYVREDMDGLAGSEHIMRVVPDPRKIPPGYLFAYLSSPTGTALVKSGTFGSVVDTIEPDFVGSLPIPRLEAATEQRIHELIERAAKLRASASQELRLIREDITRLLELPTDFTQTYDHQRAIGHAFIGGLGLRLDSYYYVGYTGQAAQAIADLVIPVRKLAEIATDIFEAPIFKRIYVDSAGMPYLMGYEVYETHPRPVRYLARNTKDLNRYVLQEGMVIIQNAGQRYGLIGTPIYANRILTGKAATNNMIRIVCPDKATAGYLFAFMNTDLGLRQILRESHGSSLPHIFAPWLAAMPIPWPKEEIRLQFGQRVIATFERRADACDAEDQAQALLTEALTTESTP